MNGAVIDNRGANIQHKAPRNYKLLTDPFIVKGAEKIYRYDGIVVPGDPTYPPVNTRDPRNPISRIRSRLEPQDIQVPRFVYMNSFHHI